MTILGSVIIDNSFNIMYGNLMKAIELLAKTANPDKDKCGIYMIYCMKDNKGYIGSTMQPFQRRFRQHKEKLNNKKHSNPHLQNAWNLYGCKSFLFMAIDEIAKGCDRATFLELEAYYINVLDKDCRFNIELNPRAKKFSEETRKKMSEARKGRFVGVNSPLYGRKKSEETKKKLSESHKGYKFTEERKRNYREKFKGENNPRFGIELSKETKHKIRIKATGRKHNDEVRKRIAESVRTTKQKMKEDGLKYGNQKLI